MAIKGSLSDVSLADICQLLAMGRKTGCLTVTDKANFGYIYFDDGRVIYSSVLNRADRLGDILVQNKAISREQLSLAIEEQKQQPGVRLGALMVDLGFVTEEEVLQYITVQLEEAVFHLFSWAQGIFHFDADQKPDEDVMGVSINAEMLLLEGARRVDEWSQIEKKIPSMDLVFALERDPTDEDEDIELTDDQRRLVRLLDGERTVTDLVKMSGLVEFDTAKALYGLIQAGFAQESGRRAATGIQEPGSDIHQQVKLGLALYGAGMLEDAEAEFEKVMEEVPNHSSVLSCLGLIKLQNRDFRKALELFEKIEDDGRSFAVIVNRAYALEQLGRYDEALELLREADELRSGNPAVLLAQGVVYLKAKKGPAAQQVFKRYRAALNGESAPPIYYAFAVLSAAVAGDLDAALKVGREGLTKYPDEPNLLVNTGVVLERKGDLDAAEVYFIRAVGKEGAPAQAHKNLGDRAYDRADHAGAGAHYSRAVEIAPHLGDDVYTRLGNIAFKEGDEELASSRWRKALELNPENEQAQANLELIST